MRKIFFLLAITLPFEFLIGQSDFFIDLNNVDELSGKNTLIYFHFEGCPTCKKMDQEVLNLSEVREYLDSAFVCFEVFGFDSIETYVRNKYEVRGDPTFLFLNNNGGESHRVVGFVPFDQFLNACRRANSKNSLSNLEAIYNSGNITLELLKNYVFAKDQAGELDSNLVAQYFSLIPDTHLIDSMYFIDLLNYGYYKGNWVQPVESRYFDILNWAYRNNRYRDLKEAIRSRLIFSLDYSLYEDDLSDSVFMHRIDLMKSLETGDRILLKDLNSKGIYSYLLDRYPSFFIEYDKAINGSYLKSHTEVFKDHYLACKNDDSELNSLAWGIYQDEFNEEIALGLEIIKTAIEIYPKYEYYDTQASLLYKYGNLNEAKLVAGEAIQKAKEQNKEYSETEALISKIDKALMGQ